jgi:hypothetical protein
MCRVSCWHTHRQHRHIRNEQHLAAPRSTAGGGTRVAEAHSSLASQLRLGRGQRRGGGGEGLKEGEGKAERLSEPLSFVLSGEVRWRRAAARQRERPCASSYQLSSPMPVVRRARGEDISNTRNGLGPAAR